MRIILTSFTLLLSLLNQNYDGKVKRPYWVNIKINFKNSVLLILLIFSSKNINSQTINDVFSDPAETTYMTRDVFAVWWDVDIDYSNQADILLDKLIAVKNMCLNTLNMQNPPNVIDSFYFNVYISGTGIDDYYSTNSGFGGAFVGTDSNGYPFMSLDFGLYNNDEFIAHEGFHVFQYNTNSTGFAEPDSRWYIEASAEWFAAIYNSKSATGCDVVVKIPQVPIWLSGANYPDNYPETWQRFVRQYTLGNWLVYLTEIVGIPRTYISESFYSKTNLTPQEYLYNLIEPNDFRNYFVDFAAHMTNNFDFISQDEQDLSLLTWQLDADPMDDNEYVQIYDNQGSDGWYRTDDTETTSAWSYNVYKLENNSDTNYTFEINGDVTGNFGTNSFFKAKILVINTDGESTFYDVPMTNSYQGGLSLDLTSNDTEVYFIIASLPEIFEDTNSEFQVFSYEIRISNQSLSINENNESNDVKIFPNPIDDYLNITFLNFKTEVDIEIYTILGQLVNKNSYYNTKSVKLNMSKMESGTYFLKVIENNTKKNLKLIKK